MRRPLLLACLLAVGCPRAPTPPPSPAPKARRETIVVAIVVDQLAAWIASERWPLLPDSGGFARLRREGTWIREVRYAHAVTDTAPGHAAIFTGVTPRENGIVANERIEKGKQVAFLRDDATKLVDAGGVTSAIGSSIARLRVLTVADRLRARSPNATIVSVSIKDRGAIFGGGRKPTATLWFDATLDRFVTSTAFGASLPTWAKPHATTSAVASLRSEPWQLLDRAFVEKHAFAGDDQAGEGDYEGLGRTFPHVVGDAKKPAVAFRATPMADQAVLALAHAAIRARDPAQPMFLAISLSANDYVTHVFGPDSWESWDELLRLDRGLEKLFTALDDAVTPEGWSAVVTADHGGVPIPELQPARSWCGGKDRWERPCGSAKRLDPVALARELDDAARAALGPGRYVAGIADPLVVYADEARSLPPERRDKLDQIVIERLKKEPGVDSVHVVRKLPALCPPHSDESVPALVCRSVSSADPGDLYIVAAPGSFFDTHYTFGQGQNHGSPYVFDRTVPLVIRAPRRIGAGVVGEGPTSFASTTRALEALNGVPKPPSCCGEDWVR